MYSVEDCWEIRLGNKLEWIRALNARSELALGEVAAAFVVSKVLLSVS